MSAEKLIGNRELELATERNKTAGKIGTRNEGTIPCVEKEEDGLHGNPHGAALISHYLQAFIEVAVHRLNHHWVVITAQ